MVSAWARRQRLVLGQETTAERSNEIKAIRKQGADYLLALKGNWPVLSAEARKLFDTAPPGSFESHETVNTDHSRIETRRAYVCRDTCWIASDRRFPGEWHFPDLAMLGMIEAEVQRGALRKGPHFQTILAVLRTAVGAKLRRRNVRPLGHREPSALGYGRDLSQ